MKMIFLLPLIFLANNSHGQSLKMLYCNRLYYQNDSVFKEIKRLGEKACFSGYKIINNEYVFLAYDQESEAEPSTIISVYNIKTEEEDIVGIVEDSGDSNFEYNTTNDLVLFASSEGLCIFKLSDALNFPQTASIQTQLILNGNFYLPFWKDSTTIGYKEWQEDHWASKTFKLEKK